MEATNLKTGLFGYRKEEVDTYIWQLQESYERRLQELEEQKEELHRTLAELRLDNDELRTSLESAELCTDEAHSSFTVMSEQHKKYYEALEQIRGIVEKLPPFAGVL